MNISSEVFEIENLASKFPSNVSYLSPLLTTLHSKHFVKDGVDRIFVDIHSRKNISDEAPTFELAGPREKLYWNPETTRVAIVTCGGLAPGLNNVIQNLVTFLYERYKVRNIFGVPYGYHGFTHDSDSKKFTFGWKRLDSLCVQNIDFEGGSVLGIGRGHSDPIAIVDALITRDINVLFVVGGDGTLAAGHAIHTEISKRELPIGVVGIPKTIDNDVLWVSKTFGFESAVTMAVEALRCAQTEARSAYNGIGLVKLMGRNSGALTATAAMAMNDIDFVLVPEVPLVLEGKNGFLNSIVRKILDKGYATVAIAEGAGQDLFARMELEYDLSGNVRLKDIGKYLKSAIEEEFKSRNIEITLKYIDPSYMLRAQTTSADDSVFCAHLGQNAVHAAMSGKTGCMIGYAHERFTHVPLSAVAMGKKHLNVDDPLWLSVLAATGQPSQWVESAAVTTSF